VQHAFQFSYAGAPAVEWTCVDQRLRDGADLLARCLVALTPVLTDGVLDEL
jgi:hypothetical protein